MDKLLLVISEQKELYFIILLIIMSSLDTIGGIGRAVKQQKINSSVGIDGIVRKAVMLLSITGLLVVDYLVRVNLVAFLPQTITEMLPNDKIGISDFFAILFILFESLSFLKNLKLTGIPLPTKLESGLNRLLTEFTNEIKEEDNKNENISN